MPKNGALLVGLRPHGTRWSVLTGLPTCHSRPSRPYFMTFHAALCRSVERSRSCVGSVTTTSNRDPTGTRLGELHYIRVQRAGDTLCDGFMSCKTPPLAVWRAPEGPHTRPEREQMRKSSPSTAPPPALPRKSSPSTHKNAEFEGF